MGHRQTTRRYDVGRRVAIARAGLGEGRERFAVACNTSSSTITRLERYGLLPSVEIVEAIAKRLGMSVDELLAPAVEEVG